MAEAAGAAPTAPLEVGRNQAAGRRDAAARGALTPAARAAGAPLRPVATVTANPAAPTAWVTVAPTGATAPGVASDRRPERSTPVRLRRRPVGRRTAKSPITRPPPLQRHSRVPPAVWCAGAAACSAGAWPPRNPSSSNCGNTMPVVQRSKRYNHSGGTAVRTFTTWTVNRRPINVRRVPVWPKRRRRYSATKSDRYARQAISNWRGSFPTCSHYSGARRSHALCSRRGHSARGNHSTYH